MIIYDAAISGGISSALIAGCCDWYQCINGSRCRDAVFSTKQHRENPHKAGKATIRYIIWYAALQILCWPQIGWSSSVPPISASRPAHTLRALPGFIHYAWCTDAKAYPPRDSPDFLVQNLPLSRFFITLSHFFTAFLSTNLSLDLISFSYFY